MAYQTSQTSSQRPACLLCGAATEQATPILHGPSPKVAGVPIDLGDTQYFMQVCQNCGFAFKYPLITDSQLLACYEAASSAQWGETVDPIQRRYDLVADMVRRHAAGNRILDVGCFTGTLLQYLGDAWNRFGVEPSTKAAALARQRNITMLGPTIEDLSTDLRFDVILSIDVLEHLVDPKRHLARITELLAPGGCFLGITGDTATRPWRGQGGRHWYAALPEHVSFYCPKALQRELGAHGLILTEHKTLRHVRPKPLDLVKETAKNHAYNAALVIHRMIPNPITRVAHRRCAPMWLTARNHMAVVFRREK